NARWRLCRREAPQSPRILSFDRPGSGAACQSCEGKTSRSCSYQRRDQGRFCPFEGGSENFQTDSRTEGLPDSGVETAQVDFLNQPDSKSNLTMEPVAV